VELVLLLLQTMCDHDIAEIEEAEEPVTGNLDGVDPIHFMAELLLIPYLTLVTKMFESGTKLGSLLVVKLLVIALAVHAARVVGCPNDPLFTTAVDDFYH